MSQRTLFGEETGSPVEGGRKEAPLREGKVRLRQPERAQVEFVATSLDSLLPQGHRARDIWAVVERLDVSGFLQGVRAREGGPGRDATDPRLLIAVWLYATAEAVGSAREVARRCETDLAYRWLCGGVSLNHHTLSDFRVGHGAALDALFTQLLAGMLHQGLVGVERIAQDGTRVRAWAGAASFRRKKTLFACAEAARRQVEACKRQADDGQEEVRRSRAEAAAQRAAEEREARIAAALATVERMAEVKRRNGAGDEARASTTDSDARVMKMPDGGFRPAYNVQLATDVEARVIVGVDVTTQGTDTGQLSPMLAQVEERVGRPPNAALVDGGYTKLEDIEEAAEKGVRVLAPPPEPKREDVDRYAPKEDDSPNVASWRHRMGKPEVQQEYKLRAATAETVNADLKAHRGFTHVMVRGLPKVKCLALWAALSYNVLRYVALGGLT